MKFDKRVDNQEKYIIHCMLMEEEKRERICGACDLLRRQAKEERKTWKTKVVIRGGVES